jgi:hypothetical protein
MDNKDNNINKKHFILRIVKIKKSKEIYMFNEL